MRLIHPRIMTEERARALKLCMARSLVVLPKKEVLPVIVHQLDSIESGVRIIDLDVPVSNLGMIDMVARDNKGCLLLIDLAPVLDARLLSQFLSQADWAVEHRGIFEHFYRDERLEGGMRFWYLAGSVSPEAESLLRHLDNSVRLEIFTYSCLEPSGERWLVVRDFMEDVGRPEVRGLGPASLSAGLRTSASELTREEIDDFFSDDEVAETCAVVDEDEITYVERVGK